MKKRTKKQLAIINDLFRETMLQTPMHKVLMTQGVSLSPDRDAVLTAVRSFKTFTKANDPHGEHDFGKVVVNGEDYFFKIDYYDKNYEYGADPATEEACRVLTIMRADEY